MPPFDKKNKSTTWDSAIVILAVHICISAEGVRPMNVYILYKKPQTLNPKPQAVKPETPRHLNPKMSWAQSINSGFLAK